jgi:ribosomal protein S18 acetylase RimI-like enzyme
MLIDIKSKLDDPLIQELLSHAVFPDPVSLDQAVSLYRDDEFKLLGYESEGDIIGLIGFAFTDSYTIEIKHIAVVLEERGKGYGRGVLLELLELESPRFVVAETDEEAVEFYRSNGFMIESIGEKYPGVERFKCTFFAEEED